MEKKWKIYRLVSLLTFLLTFIVNTLANILPFNGVTTGEVSDTFDILFVPAPYVFSIWGVIYLLLAAYLLYLFIGKQADQQLALDIAPRFWIANLANAVWLILFHFGQHLFTLPAMLVLLICLLGIYIRIQKNTLSKQEIVFVRTPFSIYLGWITVATIANATQFLYYVKWSKFGLSDTIWFIAILVVAVILSFLMSKKFKDLAYVLVLAWAFIGIGWRFMDVPVVVYSAFVAAGLVILSYLKNVFGTKTTSR